MARSDSPEAFFGCADVIFGADNAPPQPLPPVSCTVATRIDTVWQGGFQQTITVTNTSGRSITPWTLAWTLPAGSTITTGWNAVVTQDGTTVVANAPEWGRTIHTGASVSVGFVAGGVAGASGIRLNGVSCT